MAGTEVRVTHDGNAAHPSISGNKIVWQEYRNGSNNIYMYDLGIQVETEISHGQGAGSYAPSIDGNRIIWVHYRDGSNNAAIYMYDLATQAETLISSGAGIYYNPQISGDRIVWSDVRNGGANTDIYMYDLSTGIETQITTDPTNQIYPSISGNKIVWSDNRDGGFDVYMYDLNPNVAPTAHISPVSTVALGQSVSFDGSGSSDNDGTITNYQWDFGDGTTGSGVTANHTYVSAGTYNATLTITDDAGATATAMASVLVNAPPVATVAPVSTVILGETAAFDGSTSSDSDGTITNYQWDFGDGFNTTGSTVTHTYAVAGAYTVTLAVTDNDGATGMATVTVTVKTAAQATNDLIALVESMNLARGITNSLDTKLQNAASALSAENAGNREDAVNKLQAFINATQAQSGNQLTVAQAEQLIVAAQRIIAVIQ